MLGSRQHLLVAALVLACTPKTDDTGGETGGGTTGSSTGDGGSVSHTSATAPTTGEASLTGETGETGVTATAPTSASDTDATTADPTEATTDPTGETGDVPAACEAMCTKMDDCFEMPEQPHDECVSDCVGAFAGPECPAAAAAFWQCVAGLTCEELLVFIDEGPTDKCVEELGAVDTVCSECAIIGSGDGGDSCSLGRECDGLEEYVCEGDTCTCTEDGVPGTTCPSRGFCAADFDAQAEAAQDCCGWDWP